MAASAAGHVALVDVTPSKSYGAHPSAAPSAANRALPLCTVPQLMMPPWPMMMPPWMPSFGMFKQNCGMPVAHVHAPVPGLLHSTRPSACPSAPASDAKPQQHAAAPPAPSPASAAADAEQAEDDEDMGLQPDEEVVVEPDELEVFEKVAAMEQQKQQANSQLERASSPTTSCRTTLTNTDGCSPVSTLLPPLPFPHVGCFPFMPPSFSCMPLPPCMPGLPVPAQAAQQVRTQSFKPQHGKPQQAQQSLHWQQQAQQLCKPQPQQHGDADAAPLPWSLFAADDLVDDIDKDLENLIPLTETPPTPAAAVRAAAVPNTYMAAPAAAAAAAAMKAHNSGCSSLRRMGSSRSTLTCTVGVQGGAAPTHAAADNLRTGGGTPRRVLRLKGSTKGNTGGGSSSSAARCRAGGASNKITLKGSSARRDAEAQQQQQQQHQGATAVATFGLGVRTGGVLKKVAKAVEQGRVLGTATPQDTAGSTHAAPVSKVPVHQPEATKAGQDLSMSLLGDLDSSLSGCDLLHGRDAQLTDDYWESIMQDTSDEGWDSLLAANDLELTPLDC